jgi:predicted nucleotidyltransferase
MKKIGIICEYNPFHNGHLHHINEIKKKYPDSIIILVLNGYFLQRGEISLISKYDKCKIALDNNVDIVLELPVLFGTQSADTFANTSIRLLNELKVKKIVFGSEIDDIKKLEDIADKQLNDDSFNDKVKEYLKTGLNYPTALSKAIGIDFEYNPNDLLGISYIKAIRQINPKIIPETIKRTSSYHDTVSTDKIISASNLREKIKNGEEIIKYLPESVIPCINNITNNKLFNYLKFKILTDPKLSEYLDVDEGIEYRIQNVINESNNIEELIEKIKTKRYTYNKINRMLLHIMIGLTKEDNKKAKLDYIKILGFNSTGQNYLKSIRKDLNLPTTVNKNSLIYEYEQKAVYLYELATKKSLNNFDIKNIPIKKD